MAAGRSNRPLFDLLDGASSRPRAPDPTPSPIEVKPRISIPARAAPADSPRVGILTGLWSKVRPFLGDASVTLPANVLYIGAAGVVLALVLVWVIGVRVGDARAQQKLAPFTNPAPLNIHEPLSDKTANPPVLTPAPRTTPAEPKGGLEPVPPQPAPAGTTPEAVIAKEPGGPEWVFTAQGWSAKDPREPGLNYLFLGVVNRGDAEVAVKFLSDNALDALAVPLRVDPRASRGNNPPPGDALYRLVLRRGITGDEYARGLTAKQNLEAAALRLGAIWKKDHRGTTDFSKYSWEKLLDQR